MADLSPAQERAVRLALKLAHTNTEMRAMTDQHENQIATLTAELAEVKRELVEALSDAERFRIEARGDAEHAGRLMRELAEANRKLAAVEALPDKWLNATQDAQGAKREHWRGPGWVDGDDYRAEECATELSAALWGVHV